MTPAFGALDPLLPDLLALHARHRPTRTAAVFADETLTWAELAGRAHRVGNAFLAAGLAPGDRVAVLMRNGAPMLETLYGAMAAGLVAVPLNLSVTDDALAGMIEDAGARALVATSEEAARVDGSAALARSGPAFRVSSGARTGWTVFAPWRDAAAPERPNVRLDPAAPTVIIYSSGTTGAPKGIVHTLRGRTDWARDLAIALRYHSGARGLVVIGMYSNISWVVMLACLVAGAAIVVEDGFAPAALWDRITDTGVTHAALAPIMVERLLQARPEAAAWPSLQSLMTAGSPLHPRLKAELLGLFGPKIIELYGLTEGVITTLDPEVAEGRLASVGQALPGTEILILGEDDRPAPPGSPGEIVARGRIVMPGYWRRPEATEEATWTDPDGRRWLRTGDIGVLDDEGYLTIVDRKKDMILSGGQNIYPQDLEAVLLTHPAVAEAAVIGAKSATWGETPLGLVVLRTEVDLDDLRAWTNRRLGKQQRLAELVPVESLPRNPNGKLLKRELRTRYRDKAFP